MEIFEILAQIIGSSENPKGCVGIIILLVVIVAITCFLIF